MIIEIFSWLIALPLCLLLVYLALELLLGLRGLHVRADIPLDSGCRTGIIVPAHNEAAGIADTLLALQAAAPAAHILVVADNCSDETAALARATGCEVIERHDPANRGKGFALAFGRRHMAADPPDAVLIVDADCALVPGSAERLAQGAVSTGRPVQGAYLLLAEGDASPLVGISNFAILVKNLVRARGLVRLGGGALLFGTGMAFPWPLYERLPLATSNAVEDLHFGLWLAEQGVPVLLDDRAQVTSRAATVVDSRAQRSRWEHGFLQTALQQAGPLMALGAARLSRNLFTLGLHLLVPPLALLVMLSLAGLGVIAGLCFLSGHWGALAAASGAFALAMFMVLAAWWKEARAILPFSMLLRVPFYILWKIPVYIGFFGKRQTGWNRTRRRGEQPSE